MRNLKYKLARLIIKLFGDVQFFGWAPFWCILWGNTHYKVRGEEMRVIISKLRKGDILLCRFDRYVSSWFIPGWWTHVALYVGDGRVIHAMTKGVVKDDILTFLRTDHVAILRLPVSDAVKENAADLSGDLLGKKYDFLFDTSNAQAVYCSELVKFCYPGILDELGSGTIKPDRFMTVTDIEVLHDSREWRKAGMNAGKNQDGGG